MLLYERRWSFRETRLKIKSDSENSIKLAIESALNARRKIERFIVGHPEFRNSLEPLNWDEENYSGIIHLMLRGSKIAKVGPFAAVAGSISQVATESITRRDDDNILVDNGGDVSIAGNREFKVGIYAGDSPASGKFAFLINPENLPLGICTSSGSVGHSISFGDSDAVTVVADECSIADAVATGVANEVKGDDIESSIKRGLDRADDIPEIEGCLIVRGESMGRVGRLPKILSLSDGNLTYPEELTPDSRSILE
ncbi:hypothetical protein AKJ62_00320 [candidate division MSBL1 archaeon SCGC-AAA259D14]|uniref:Uncharacterized protein n=2 Tax=candidate division MSBL1 TaxID=215777 RepID=A0A133U8Z4_9EURY|nr:hypothetical protein AKJ62_00320 [candidate division MSBL1 archaeon SCGC-AAA259D14]KXA93854.1 hypothetical protein AKJ66_00720 [candidate division MSBL1 archaeon SCGC-AAA259E22]